jgi:hypothetical protein
VIGYQAEVAELSRRGSRNEARAALAHMARERTHATRGELAELLGVSRADSVPNLTRRFARRLAQREDVRARLGVLEERLRLRQGLSLEKPETWCDPALAWSDPALPLVRPRTPPDSVPPP